MKKLLNKLSIILIFTLILQLTLPLASSANTLNELDLIRQQTNLPEDDIQLSLEIISDHSDIFLEYADPNVLDSYGFEDQNIAILKYFYDINYSEKPINSLTVSSSFSADTNIKPQPRMVSIFIRYAIKDKIKDAIKDKMGERIKKEIGDQVKDKVEDKWVDAARKQIDEYGYSKFVGPQGSGANGIRQGEHVFEIYGKNGKSIMRADVGRERNGATTNWHYHLPDDNFKYHHEQTLLNHNTLPAWGSPAK